jgi:AraC family transcriptional regulator, regulatory protein of adaptative response / methylated-DNA-[protein]-cysteine methyltransferase
MMRASQPGNAADSPRSGRASLPASDSAARWQQVLTRDRSANGQFFYAVKTTRIYCRPGCPSRRPARGNVAFFSTSMAAEQAGYRPCKRCEPNRPTSQLDPQARLIAVAVRHLQSRPAEKVRLEELARVADASRLTIFRAFRRVLGVSPQEFARAQRVRRFQETLRPGAKGPSVKQPNASTGLPRSSGKRITDAIYEAGFGSSSRIYEKSAEALGMTPKQLRSGGAGIAIRYTTAASPLGRVLVAASDIGICSIAFAGEDEQATADLRKRFPKAQLTRDAAPTGWLKQAVQYTLSQMTEHPLAATFPLDVRATAFQQRVWKALQQIPRGQTRSYSDVARDLGRPSAVRAVAAAIGSNPIALAIPCHRVIGSNGSLTGYRWGLERKRRLLNAEGRDATALPGEEIASPHATRRP